MKLSSKQRKIYRVRNNLKKVSKEGRYRLSVSRSSKNISAQIIDDNKSVTILSASSRDKTIKSLNIPVIPGSNGNLNSCEDGIDIASKIGYPVLIKAASGGGGRGMRLVLKESEFSKNLQWWSLEWVLLKNKSNVSKEI